MTIGLKILEQIRAIQLPRIIQEEQKEVLALLNVLEANLEEVPQAKIIAENLLDILERIDRKSTQVQKERDGCDSRNMDNCDQGTILFEQTIREMAVLLNELKRLLAWRPERHCSWCEKQIEPERLEIVQDTTLCAECARQSCSKRGN